VRLITDEVLSQVQTHLYLNSVSCPLMSKHHQVTMLVAKHTVT